MGRAAEAKGAGKDRLIRCDAAPTFGVPRIIDPLLPTYLFGSERNMETRTGEKSLIFNPEAIFRFEPAPRPSFASLANAS